VFWQVFIKPIWNLPGWNLGKFQRILVLVENLLITNRNLNLAYVTGCQLFE
jgi:hypothetical protein